MISKIIIWFSVLFLIKVSNCAKILVNAPLTTVSEQSLYTPLVTLLASRGHEVTSIVRNKATYDFDPSKNGSVREIVPLDFSGYMDLYADPVVNRKIGWKLLINMEYGYNIEACHRVWNNPDFVQATREQYDLIITNSFFHACLYGIIWRQGVPFILVGTLPLVGYSHDLTGARMPTSYVPNSFFSSTDKMNLIDRIWNTVLDHYFTIYFRLCFMSDMDKINHQYVGEDSPPTSEIERNVSLTFSNTHVSVTPPRPLTPDVIEVGGLHCRPAKQLPKDLDEFLSGSGEAGFIYFSLGSILQGHQMPETLKKTFLNVFAGLKQRVLWKYEVNDLGPHQVPSNVMLHKWLPQQDILGHPKIKIFITHSGMFSTQEAVYHGVPLIGMPIFVDQNLNIRYAVDKGYAIELELLDLNEEKLSKAINDILTNQTYTEKAKEVSSLFRDQIETPSDRAAYWVDYVIKYKGAPHLRSSARDLNFIQYHCLDVLFILLMVLLLSGLILKKIIVVIYHGIQSLFNRNRVIKSSSKKHE